MNLKIHKPVYYSNACLFKLVGPGNITLFIKACFKFNKYNNLFTTLGCSFQSINNRGVATCSVQGHFYCKNVIIVCSIRKEFYNRVVRFIRHVKNFIMQLEGIPVRFILRKVCRVKMFPWFKTEFACFVCFAQLHKTANIYHAVCLIYIIICKLKLFFKKVTDYSRAYITLQLNREGRFSLD